MYIDFIVRFRRNDATLTHSARAYRGGVSKKFLHDVRPFRPENVEPNIRRLDSDTHFSPALPHTFLSIDAPILTNASECYS